MSDAWIGHWLETEEGAATCLINVALAENCPDPERPLCVMIRIPFREPGEEGMGDQAERDAFSAFEDEIEARAEELNGVHFASVRGMGVLDVWYYAPVKSGEAIADAAREVCDGYEIEVGGQEDAEWEQFQMLFPPPEAIAEYQDSQLIQTLQEQGDRLDKARPVEHVIVLPDDAAATKAAGLAAKLGFSESNRFEWDEEEHTVAVELTKSHSVEPETVTEARRALTEIAENLGGEYDGWQTPLAT